MDITMSALQVLLLAIMFLAILVEVKTGGTGAGIIFGLVAAGVFWGSQYVKGAADLFQIGLFLGGILCIIVEMLLPTVGLLAGVGVAAMLYSLVMALGGNFAAVTVLILALVAAIGVFALVVNQLPASRLWKRFVLKDQSTSKRGYVSVVEEPHLVGERGKVLTELRPSGSRCSPATPSTSSRKARSSEGRARPGRRRTGQPRRRAPRGAEPQAPTKEQA